LDFGKSIFDLESGIVAKDSGDPNKTFHQMINDTRVGPNDIDIFTNDSKSSNQELLILAVQFIVHKKTLECYTN